LARPELDLALARLELDLALARLALAMTIEATMAILDVMLRWREELEQPELAHTKLGSITTSAVIQLQPPPVLRQVLLQQAIPMCIAAQPLILVWTLLPVPG